MLQFEQVDQVISGKQTLNQVSFRVETGQIYALLGPNGAGKSTVINLISQLRTPQRGQIWFQGERFARKHLRHIGIASQENLLYRHLTCRENLQFFGALYGLSSAQCRMRSQICLDQVQLIGQADALVSTLSGGMQRRLNLAIALMHEPSFLVLDEPTTGLDLDSRQALWQLLQALHHQGMTILLTTHLLEAVQKLGEQLPDPNDLRIGILQQGHLRAEGELSALRRLIPAQEILLLRTQDDTQAINLAQKKGWQHRWYGHELGLWLPESLPLATLVEQFQSLEIIAIRRQAIGLEHLYQEVLRQSA